MVQYWADLRSVPGFVATTTYTYLYNTYRRVSIDVNAIWTTSSQVQQNLLQTRNVSECLYSFYYLVVFSMRKQGDRRTDLGRESAEEGVPEVTEREREVLVEEVLEELAHAQIGPAAVHEQQALQVAELSHREVAGEHRLHALLTADSDTDVCRCTPQRQP